MKAQKERILAHLKTGKRLSPLDALFLFNCFRLGARIWDLKQEGYPIKSEIVTNERGKRYSEYWLEVS